MIVQRFLRILGCGMVFLSSWSRAQPAASPNMGVPQYLVTSRIEALNNHTPLSLVYNKHVQAYIDVYTQKRPEHLANIIGRSQLYFPLFEEYLDKYDLPLELKYLAVIESALEPRAKSSSGAYGLWQFLYHASRMFDLQVNTYTDERADPVLSTDAACRYLKYLYDNFKDWHLAIAAYNVGIGEVKEAIRKAGGVKDYWEIRHLLPVQAHGYVPAFIAVNYVMNHYSSYGIVPQPAPFVFDDLATVEVPGGISFQQIAHKTKVDTETLGLLNPSYKLNYIPQQALPVRIVVPQSALPLFIENSDNWSSESAPAAGALPPVGDKSGRIRGWHKVEPGEFFHKIAMAYECRIEDLMAWNNLKDKSVNAGQVLEVWKLCLTDNDQTVLSDYSLLLP